MIGQCRYEVEVTYHSYSNPTGRCAECGGGTVPGCCDVPSPVPLDSFCSQDACDTAMAFCFRPVGSTDNCTQQEQTLAPRALLNRRFSAFDGEFFGLRNPPTITSNRPWQVSSDLLFIAAYYYMQGLQILFTFHECFLTKLKCLFLRLGQNFIMSYQPSCVM